MSEASGSASSYWFAVIGRVKARAARSVMDWGWRFIPPGFVTARDQRGRLLVVREILGDGLPIEMICDKTGEVSPYHGRDQLRCLRLADGERALVRSYRHGGLLRGLTRDIFFTWPPRPLRELAVSEELHHRGMPTVEPCGACVEPLWGPFYRGWFITRELTGARDLWETVSGSLVRGFDMAAILRAAADAIKLLHREGVYHRDLNMKNILVRRENSGLRCYIIDFDKATLFLGRLPDQFAERNLNRLRRSARKLDPLGRYISEAAWKDFLDRYYDTGTTGS
ncbi:MAG TPA: lipopolysaccharide kinase InaA family protein [Candidatus Binatia bacterium]